MFGVSQTDDDPLAIGEETGVTFPGDQRALFIDPAPYIHAGQTEAERSQVPLDAGVWLRARSHSGKQYSIELRSQQCRHGF